MPVEPVNTRGMLAEDWYARSIVHRLKYVTIVVNSLISVMILCRSLVAARNYTIAVTRLLSAPAADVTR